MAHIKNIKVDIFDSAFQQIINFSPGLNIISGINGTGKTTVLTMLKSKVGDPSIVQTEGQIASVLAFSPKRNTEKKKVEVALQFIRQNSRTKETYFQEALGRAVADNTFTSYESLGSIFVYDFEEKMRVGNMVPVDVMKAVEEEYNSVIKSVFPDYEILTDWVSNLGSSGSPAVKLISNYGIPLDLDLMSCGESEVLALIFNLYINRSNTDVYLIDEPEVHLNWSLEKGLFTFFDNFSKENGKQIIVTSHSRVIFDKKFRSKTQFFTVRDKKVYVETNPPTEYLEQIAGEATTIISTAAPTEKTFFVEDDFHKLMISELLKLYNKTAQIVVVKDASGAIQNFFKVIKSNNEINEKWVNAYLMIDGDGKQQMYQQEPRFIHLQRHAAESYMFSLNTMARCVGANKTDLVQKIIEIMNTNSDFIGGKNARMVGKLLRKLKKGDITLDFMSSFDCSEVLKNLLGYYNKNVEDFVSTYLLELKTKKRLSTIFDKKLRAAIKA